jgi:uncharacterized protein YndB with AHSA1/START domain
MTNPVSVERKSDRELVVTRRVNAPADIVFQAWSTPDLFLQWWVPKTSGVTLLSHDMDIRTGGTYRLVFSHPAAPQPMTFFGTYSEVTPARMSWTNEESPDGAVTTVTFTEQNGETLVVLTDLYPSKNALDAAIASGSTSGFDEQFGQLDALLQ